MCTATHVSSTSATAEATEFPHPTIFSRKISLSWEQSQDPMNTPITYKHKSLWAALQSKCVQAQLATSYQVHGKREEPGSAEGSCDQCAERKLTKRPSGAL